MENQDSQVTDAQGVLIFESNVKTGLWAGLSLSGGLVMLLFGIFMFGVQLLLPAEKSSPMALTMGVTMPVMFAVFSFTTGIWFLRQATRVELHGEGLSIIGLLGTSFIPWQQIAELKSSKHKPYWSQETRDILTLLDENGKALGQISSLIRPFPVLMQEIETRSSQARGAATYDREKATDAKLADRKRQQRILMTLSAGIFVVCVAGAVWSGLELIAARELVRDGVKTEARIDLLERDGDLPWLRYSFQDAEGGQHSNRVALAQASADELASRKTVTVRYLPMDPERHEVLVELAHADDDGLLLLMACGGMLLFGALFGFAWWGGDIEVENGKFTLIKPGEIRPDPLAAGERTVSPPPIPVAEAERPVMAAETDAPERPKGIAALAALALVLSAIGVVWQVVRLGFGLLVLGGSLGDMGFAVELNPLVHFLDVGVNLVLALGGGIAGFGLLRMRRWGWRLALAIAGAQLLTRLAGILIVIHNFTQMEPGLDGSSTPFLVGAGGGIVLELFRAIFPIVLLIVLTSPKGRQLFAKRS